MAFLKLLEEIRNPVLDTVFSLVTMLGEETLFLVVGLVLYWCISKRKGLYLLSVGLIGTIPNQWMKILCRVPRPWVRDPQFTIVEAARARATGYSFPSGHSQSAVSVFGSLAVMIKKRRARILLIVAALLVIFSRMYLGVHYPTDVLVGGGMSLLFVLGLAPFMIGPKANEKRISIILCLAMLLSGAFAVFMLLKKFPADTDPVNYAEAVKNAWTLFGASIGLVIGHWLENRYVRFDEKGAPATQAVKLILGVALTMGLRVALKPLMGAILGTNPVAHAIRYAIVVFFAAGIWPMAFPRIARMTGKRG